MLRVLLTLLIFICCLTKLSAQDTCTLSFVTSDAQVTKVHQKKLAAFKDNRIVMGVNAICVIPTKGNISLNRVAAERRLQMVRNNLVLSGIPYNRIRSSLVLPDTETELTEVIVDFNFANKKGEKILRKTPIVQVSTIGYTKKNVVLAKPPKDVKIEKTLLNVEDFKKDKKISLPNLLFETSTHFFVPGSEKVLLELAKIMKSKPSMQIELQGHICCRLGGTDGMDPVTEKFNLSEMRAKAVYLYLLAQGIAANRMTFVGFASRNKLYPQERNQMEMMLNRRVEVFIVED